MKRGHALHVFSLKGPRGLFKQPDLIRVMLTEVAFKMKQENSDI